jgi:hypothetical protein
VSRSGEFQRAWSHTNEWALLLPASVVFGALIPVCPESAIVVGVFLVAFL